MRLAASTGIRRESWDRAKCARLRSTSSPSSRLARGSFSSEKRVVSASTSLLRAKRHRESARAASTWISEQRSRHARSNEYGRVAEQLQSLSRWPYWVTLPHLRGPSQAHGVKSRAWKSAFCSGSCAQVGHWKPSMVGTLRFVQETSCTCRWART